jgi:hypothetical protein
LIPWIDKEIKLLEIGVHKGGSLHLWRDYFPRSTIIGIDRRLPQHFEAGGRVQLFEGNQIDKAFLSKVANWTAPEGFDIIVDDASHVGELTRTTFWHLFDHHLKPGGLYAIEDWGTGYLGDFPDGKEFDAKPSVISRLRSLVTRCRNGRMKMPVPCHSYGMVGFIKELVDEQGAASIAMGRKAGWRGSKFKTVLITPGVVFVTKARSTLAAAPNPVPPDDAVGKTKISWSVAEKNPGKIWVSFNGGKESLFASGSQGAASANWIKEGGAYEFRLYDSEHTRLLDKVTVTKAKG